TDGTEPCVRSQTFTHLSLTGFNAVVFVYGSDGWTVPSDWNNASNTIEVIGGGGSNSFVTGGEPGAGGGAYSKVSNVSLTPSASVGYSVGAGGPLTDGGGNGGDT